MQSTQLNLSTAPLAAR